MKERATDRNGQMAGYLVGIGFLITALGFAVQRPSASVPIVEAAVVEEDQIRPGAFRVAMTDPPLFNPGFFNQKCNDCHGLFQNDRDPSRALTQHTDILLAHGTNDACLNCHNKEQRDKLNIRGSDPIGYDEVQQLCAQCHGPVYRDWQAGTHGKTIGFWNGELGESIKLSCTQCHDPHSPAFAPMAPLPGPNTLRMGDQHGDHENIDPHNPLTRWRLLPGGGVHHSESEGDH